MGQILHGSATTTEAVRRAIHHSQASLRTLSRRYGINPKTVAKWKKRGSVADLPTGPKQAKSTVLSVGRGDRRRLSQAHTLATRRLPLRPSGHDTAPDPLVIASLSPAPRHLAAAGRRRWQGPEAQVQGLPYRLLPHRYRRGPHPGGTALPLCGH